MTGQFTTAQPHQHHSKERTIKTIIALIIVLTCFAAACSQATPLPQGSVVLDPPRNGDQYSPSEICAQLEAEGYDVTGTLAHTFSADELSPLTQKVPRLARGVVENYIDDGITIRLRITSLCSALNP